jgi:hypothetical protein
VARTHRTAGLVRSSTSANGRGHGARRPPDLATAGRLADALGSVRTAGLGAPFTRQQSVAPQTDRIGLGAAPVWVHPAVGARPARNLPLPWRLSEPMGTATAAAPPLGPNPGRPHRRPPHVPRPGRPRHAPQRRLARG